MVEQEGHGVREDLAHHQPTSKMPEVTRPHPLYTVAFGQLRKDGVDPVAKTAEQSTPLRSGISLFFGGVRGQKLYAHLRQLFFGLGRVVVAVSDKKAAGALGEFGEHRELVGVSRGYREAGDEPWPADPHVHPKAVEGLLDEGVLAESSLSFKTRAAVGTGEQACRQRQRVAKREGGIVRDLSAKRSCQRCSLAFQRLAACLLKVVRCTDLRFGKKWA
jgi:hypothetical protein